MKLLSSSGKILFGFKRITKRIWFRSFLYALVGIATAFIALIAAPVVPEGFTREIGSAAVGNILAILASSMLAVSTFSLSIMVSAFGNASTGASPRATNLLIENQNAQRAVATFIGAFLYSIVGLIALTSHAYGDAGRFVLFVVTILVIIVIVVTLIRWVDQLATLGRVGSTIAEVESAAWESIEDDVWKPFLGARSESEQNFAESPSAIPVIKDEIGFIAFIDVSALDSICLERGIEVCVVKNPGSFNYPSRPIAYLNKPVSEDCLAEIKSHFIIEAMRTFNQDPRFGFILLAEIGSKALSSAINDSGTAIEVLSSAVRLLTKRSLLLSSKVAQAEPKFPRVFVPSITVDELLGDLIVPMARDGAGVTEVGVRIQRSLSALHDLDPAYRNACQIYARFALEHSNRALHTDFEKNLVKDASLLR